MVLDISLERESYICPFKGDKLMKTVEFKCSESEPSEMLSVKKL